MGLDISPGDFSCGYGGFFSFRKAVCAATGGTYGIDGWRFGDGYDSETHPGLYALLTHSDCDGSIEVDMCRQIADELEALNANGAVQNRLLQPFIAACRLAVETNETMEFM
jgi:hypothetical protein